MSAKSIDCATNHGVSPGLGNDAWSCDTGGAGEVTAYWFTDTATRDAWARDQQESGESHLLIGPAWVVTASDGDLVHRAQRAVGGRMLSD